MTLLFYSCMTCLALHEEHFWLSVAAGVVRMELLYVILLLYVGST